MTDRPVLFDDFLAGGMRETARLSLRLLRPDDAPTLYRILAEPAVARWIYFIARPYTHSHAESWCARARVGAESGKELLFAVIDRANGRIIGNAHFHLLADGTQAEIGYWLAADRHGSGYGSEIVQALVTLAGEFPAVSGLAATAGVENVSAVRVLAKSGFQKTGQIAVTTATGDQRLADIYTLPVNGGAQAQFPA